MLQTHADPRSPRSASVPDARPTLLHRFDGLSDRRVTARCAYPSKEMLLVALFAVTCDADDLVHAAEWGKAKLDWLRRSLPFEAGVASHGTLSRVFAQLDSQRFEDCFRAWMSQLCPSLEGHNIAVDGKSVRGSHEAGPGMAHLVSAWHTEAGLTLGQVRTVAKSNEITAIPALLDALDIRDATITMDALGCQCGIVAREAHYLIDLGSFGCTARAVAGPEVRGHGRFHPRGHPGQRPHTEWRYYISSKMLDAAEFSRQIQAHWQIENCCP